jgi:uncharacterized repeat protein (TIGR03809 family)
MQEGIPGSFSDVTRKWLSLAERRKAHLVELYESGRWRLYYNEAEFISRLREAIREIELWSATEQASRAASEGGAALRDAAMNGVAAIGVAANGFAMNGVAASGLAADGRLYFGDHQGAARENE